MLRGIGILGLLTILLAGCVSPQARMQMAEEAEKERDLDIRTVGDVTEVGNVAPLQIFGVGLVTNLSGSGHSPHGFYRDLMQQILLKRSGSKDGSIVNDEAKISVRKTLDDPNNCLVIISGFIPGGARKGERFDVDVTLPAGSKASSLVGGQLQVCWLKVYEKAANLSDKYNGSNRVLEGHILGRAHGPLIVGFGNNVDVHELKRARVWHGGTSLIDRPYHFIMKNDDKSIRIANSVASRINFMYQDDPSRKKIHSDFNDQENQILNMGNIANQLNQKNDANGMNVHEMAKPMSKDVINVRVPHAYRLDHERFVRVSRFTPLRDTDPNLVRYRQRLQKMLLDPHEAQRAAMRLESLGRASIAALKAGLDSDHPFVRYVSAESLAYVGSTLGVDTLAEIAHKHPIFGVSATLALANLGETICRDRLTEMLTNDEPSLRCAAFHALSKLDETDPRLGTLNLNDSFWISLVPQAPNRMVYYATGTRPQLMLFGKGITLAAETRMMVGKDFTIAPADEPDKIVVKRITFQGERKRVSSRRLDETLIALAELGATYADAVEFLRKASDYQHFNCPILPWTITEVPLESLVEAGRSMK